MIFNFKVGEGIKKAWVLYKDNFGNIFILILISAFIQFVSEFLTKKDYGITTLILSLVFTLIGLLLSYVWIKSSIDLIDGKKFDPFKKEMLPDLVKFWDFLKTSILVAFCVLGGFILLIIPAFYISGRLLPAIYLSVEKSQGARNSIKEAWEKTKDNGWKIFWKSFLIGIFMFIGFMAFFVGALITYPIGMFVMIMLYREIMKKENISLDGVASAEVVKEEIKLESNKLEEPKEEIVK